MFCRKKIKTKHSNVHDSLKVMGSNPVYLLKSSLLYQVAFRVCILRDQKNSMPEVLTKNVPAFGKSCGLEMTETNIVT